MDLNRSALQTVPEKRCFPFLTMVYFVCSMETGTDTLLFAIVWMIPMQKMCIRDSLVIIYLESESDVSPICPQYNDI